MALSYVPRSASPAPDSKISSRNPISVRLYKALASNFDDDATQEALQTLSDLYVTSSRPKEPTRLSSEDAQYDDFGSDATICPAPSLMPILVESVPGESAAKARRNLRRDMESKLTSASRQFMEAFGEVDQVCVFQICVYIFSVFMDLFTRLFHLF